jgi:Rha family phage regulatory protein
MAEYSISILASVDNPVVHTINGKPAVSSKDVALRFQRKHKHILEEIKRILIMCPKSFTEPNFRPSEYSDSTGRALPCWLLTRDAFSLLAMGFTGRAAILWKLKYIEAFNTLEQAALEKLSAQVVEARNNLLALERKVEAVRQSALAEGRMQALGLYRRLTPQRKTLMRRALHYKGMGLGCREIGKLMDCSHQQVWYLLKDAAMLGMEARRDPAQH